MAGHGHSVDEYLEVIYFLAFPIGEYRPAGESAIASRVADMLGVSRASARYEHSSKAKLFGDIEDEGFIGVSRNHWLGYRFSNQLMLRGGRINLPFGVRTPDHTMWVRAETMTDRESDQQHGLSIVYSDHNIRGELLGSIGNPYPIRGRGLWVTQASVLSAGDIETIHDMY